MADKKFTDLVNKSTAASADIVPIVDPTDNTTKRTTVSGLASAVASNLPAGSITGASIANYKIARQNDTTNISESTAKILTGWGVIVPGAVTTASETVTFSSVFTSAPIVVLTYGGDNASATTYGSGVIAANVATATAHTITASSFIARIQSTGGAWAAGNTVFYQWIAIGA